MRTSLVLLFFGMLLTFSCKEKQKSTSTPTESPAMAEEEPYFSISQYFDDQWQTRKDNPYTLLRIVNLNGRTDSSFVPLDSVLWQNLRAYFDAGDISQDKFKGQYKYNIFEDESTQSLNLIYEAKEPDLFTTKMLIGADMYSKLVRSVYMETKKEKKNYLQTQKLSYIPDRVFQIQEFEHSLAAPDKKLFIEYRFSY